MRFCLIVIGCLWTATLYGQPKSDNLLTQLLFSNKDTLFQKVLNDPSGYRLQIIYTRIDRDKRNRPQFHNYYYHVDPNLYFNPASTVKLPLALLALEKLNQLNQEGVNKFTAMQFDSSYAGQTIEYTDSTSENRLPSIAQFIRKAFLISDNDAYNRLYQFTGQQTINDALHQKGYPDIRITRQFMGFTTEQNRRTNPIRFIRANGTLIQSQPAAYNPDSFYLPPPILLGKGHFNRDDSLVQGPFDFTGHNNLSLENLQQLLQSALFPASVPPTQRFQLTDDDYKFLHKFLSQFPGETNYPYYDTSVYYDSYVKFFFRNATHRLPPSLRVFNKVGWAYGFLTDVSYVADFANKVEFMLSCTLYVNSDSILNDNHYDYDSIGYPFLYSLGQTIYQYELKRPRKHPPDLSTFRIEYDHRDPADKRTPIKDADN